MNMLRDQDLLRKKLADFFKANPKTLSEVAAGIGTSVVTLRNFLLKGGVLHFRTWVLIDNYIDNLEKTENINIKQCDTSYNKSNEKG